MLVDFLRADVALRSRATPTYSRPPPRRRADDDSDADADSDHPDADSVDGLPGREQHRCAGGDHVDAYTGPSTISTPGTVIDGKSMGCVRVSAPGVVIRNSRISCAGSAVASYDGDYAGDRLLLEDVEIDCRNAPGSVGVGDALVTVRRAEITGCENGLDINQEVTIEDSYIHGFYNGGEAHMDGIQLAGHYVNGQVVGGALNVVIRHNTIYGMDPNGQFGTSAIITNPSGDVNILIENNVLAGGAATVYLQPSRLGHQLPADQQPVQHEVQLQGRVLLPDGRLRRRDAVRQRLPRDRTARCPWASRTDAAHERSPGPQASCLRDPAQRLTGKFCFRRARG